MWLSKTLIHLHVDDARQSAVFYEALLGAAPAQRHSTLFVFDLDSPPLVLTVEEDASRASAHNRFALVVIEPEHVGDAAIRLRRAGVRLRIEDQGIRADDPDGNAWRVRLASLGRDRTVLSRRAVEEEKDGDGKD